MPILVHAPDGADVVEVEALVDTGADVCALPQRHITALDLPPVRMARVAGVFRVTRELIVYRADVELVGVDVFQVEVFATNNAHAIVGRSILQHLVFLLDGPGEVFELALPEE